MNKKVKQGCECKDKKKESNSMDEIEQRRERVEKVTELFRDVHYKTEDDRDAAILSFTKANLTLDEIAKLVEPLRPDYLAGQVYKKGVF